MTAPRETTELVAVDLTDALAYIVIRANPDNPYGVVIDAASRGISKLQASQVLRHLADKWAVEGQ